MIDVRITNKELSVLEGSETQRAHIIKRLQAAGIPVRMRFANIYVVSGFLTRTTLPDSLQFSWVERGHHIEEFKMPSIKRIAAAQIAGGTFIFMFALWLGSFLFNTAPTKSWYGFPLLLTMILVCMGGALMFASGIISYGRASNNG